MSGVGVPQLVPIWSVCPYGNCEHGLILHDGDGDDEPFICTVESCPCDGRREP